MSKSHALRMKPSISSSGAASTPNGAVSEHSQKAFEDGSNHAIASRPQKAKSVRLSDTRMPVKVTSQGGAGARQPCLDDSFTDI